MWLRSLIDSRNDTVSRPLVTTRLFSYCGSKRETGSPALVSTALEALLDYASVRGESIACSVLFINRRTPCLPHPAPPSPAPLTSSVVPHVADSRVLLPNYTSNSTRSYCLLWETAAQRFEKRARPGRRAALVLNEASPSWSPSVSPSRPPTRDEGPPAGADSVRSHGREWAGGLPPPPPHSTWISPWPVDHTVCAGETRVGESRQCHMTSLLMT